MKINCQTTEFMDALNIVSKTAAVKTTTPILSGVLIEAFNNKIKLTTYDLEIGSTTVMECAVEEEGATVVDLKMLNEIIRKLEASQIVLEADESLFTIKSINGIFKLSVMNPEEFPNLPTFSIENSLTIEQNLFKEMIKKTLFAVSNDENRPIYTGSLLKVESNILTVVALDGFRLALKKYYNTEEINDFKAIIPGKVLNELLRILSDDENKIKIGTNKNQALFEMGNSTIVSRIIDGEFLNYNSIIPSNKTTSIRVKTKNLLDALERVALFARESTEKDKKSPVRMSIKIDGTTLSCVSQTGDAKENIDTSLIGNDLEIGFNPRYFLETLKVIDDEEINIDFTSSIAPAVITPVNGKSYMYIVLPVKLK